jgi:hypothetical protein
MCEVLFYSVRKTQRGTAVRKVRKVKVGKRLQRSEGMEHPDNIISQANF